MLQHGWIWKHLLNKFTVSEIQDTLQAVKHSPLSILVGLKHRPGGFATHLFKIQHQHIVDLKVHAHTGSSREERQVARKAERGGVFNQSSLNISCFEQWTLPVKNKQRLPKKAYRWAMVTWKDAHILSHIQLYHTMDCSPWGSSVHGSFQARILGWVAISFSMVSSWPRDWTCVSCVSYIAGVFFIRWAFVILFCLILVLFCLTLFYLPCCMACGVLVSPPGMEPMPLAMKTES